LLQAQKDQAQVAYQDAMTQYNKLSVKAPIAGTIGSIMVDVGQEVANGTPLFTISSTSNQQIEVYLSQDELSYVYLGISVLIRDQQKILSGRIASISSVADANLNYKAIVSLDRPVALL
jgi:multidrug resistance efflux pump